MKIETGMQNVRLAAAAALIAVMAGCAASAPETTPATHYWESSQAPENRYRQDNVACQSQTQQEAGAQDEFALHSDAFEAYRDCMVNRGYVLRNY